MLTSLVLVACVLNAVAGDDGERRAGTILSIVVTPAWLLFMWRTIFPFDWLGFTEKGKEALAAQNARLAQEQLIKDRKLVASGDGWVAVVGIFAGSIAALIAFIWVYIAAVGSVGWVIGIALGWFPAMLAAGVAFLVFRFLWPLALVGVLVLVTLITNG